MQMIDVFIQEMKEGATLNKIGWVAVNFAYLVEFVKGLQIGDVPRIAGEEVDDDMIGVKDAEVTACGEEGFDGRWRGESGCLKFFKEGECWYASKRELSSQTNESASWNIVMNYILLDMLV